MCDSPGRVRLVPLRPEELNEDQVILYDAVSGGRRALGPQLFQLRRPDGSLTGPFDLMLRHPAVGRRLSELGECLRYGGLLSDRAREIAILVVAATRDSAYEWYAHEPIARAVGLSDAEIHAIRAATPESFDDGVEAASYSGTRLLLKHGAINEEDYSALITILGAPRLVELVALVGYYDLLASLLAVFGIGPPEHEQSLS